VRPVKEGSRSDNGSSGEQNFGQFVETRVRWFEDYLRGTLERYRTGSSQRFLPLLEALAYSLDGGGKRLRPLLMLASAECVGLDPKRVLPAACAMEFVHTYSLIHDDLPALDDDDMRRGKLANHKRFGEATAILAGDALLTEAFAEMARLASEGSFSPKVVVDAIAYLANSAGLRGMVGGQFLDTSLDGRNASLPEIEFIHIHKTGALILASVMLPAKLAEANEDVAMRLKRFGEAAGLAFQISDDLLDAESGLKSHRGFRKRPSPSYADQMTRVELKEKLAALVGAAVESTRPLGSQARWLVGLAEFIGSRQR
jgi:geranylgeranyl diphosphate synthase type II